MRRIEPLLGVPRRGPAWMRVVLALVVLTLGVAPSITPHSPPAPGAAATPSGLLSGAAGGRVDGSATQARFIPAHDGAAVATATTGALAEAPRDARPDGLLAAATPSAPATPGPTAPCGNGDCTVAAWVIHSLPIPSYQWMLAIACPTASSCIAVGQSGAILTTGDNGQSWVPRNGGYGGPFGRVACATATRCFAAGPDDIMASTQDGGQTWTPQSIPGGNALTGGITCPTALVCRAEGTVNLGNGIQPGIATTTDGGTTWTVQAVASTSDPFHITCPSVDVCYGIGGANFVPAFLVTTDGGQRWSSVPAGTTQDLDALACPTTTVCYAAGYGGVIVGTKDGGATWSVEPSATTNDLYDIACPSATVCYAVGNFATVAVTSDGGRTWSAQSLDVPLSGALESVACPAVNACYAVGGEGVAAAGLPVIPPTATPTDTATPTNTPQAFQPGDVFVDGGHGVIDDFAPSGALRQPLDTTLGTFVQDGLCFDTGGNLYGTEWVTNRPVYPNNNLSQFDASGHLLAAVWGRSDVALQGPTDCVVDAAGNVYVGDWINAPYLPNARMWQFHPDGSIAGAWSLPIPGTDNDVSGLDLGPDQCTLYYTLDDTTINRASLCSGTPFESLRAPTGPCVQVRARSNGEMLAACGAHLYLLDPYGTVMRTYTPSAGPFASVGFAPGGTAFWTIDQTTGRIEEVDLATGAVTAAFAGPDPATPTGWGIGVFQGLRAAQSTPEPTDTRGPQDPTYTPTATPPTCNIPPTPTTTPAATPLTATLALSPTAGFAGQQVAWQIDPAAGTTWGDGYWLYWDGGEQTLLLFGRGSSGPPFVVPTGATPGYHTVYLYHDGYMGPGSLAATATFLVYGPAPCNTPPPMTGGETATSTPQPTPTSTLQPGPTSVLPPSPTSAPQPTATGAPPPSATSAPPPAPTGTAAASSTPPPTAGEGASPPIAGTPGAPTALPTSKPIGVQPAPPPVTAPGPIPAAATPTPLPIAPSAPTPGPARIMPTVAPALPTSAPPSRPTPAPARRVPARPTARPSVTPMPGHAAGKRSRSPARRKRLALSIHVAHSHVRGGSTLVAVVQTAPRTRIAISLVVSRKRTVSVRRAGRPAAHVTRTVILYRTGARGVAGRHGRLVARLHITWRPAKAVRARMTVRAIPAGGGHGTATGTLWVTIQPPPPARAPRHAPHRRGAASGASSASYRRRR